MPVFDFNELGQRKAGLVSMAGARSKFANGRVAERLYDVECRAFLVPPLNLLRLALGGENDNRHFLQAGPGERAAP